MRSDKKIDPTDDESVKGDMTPMIDIIFLLLIFFLLTTKFIVPEKMISQLLPTNKGQRNTAKEDVLPPDDVNILIYPEGFTRGMGVEEMDALWREKQGSSAAMIQVGQNTPIRIHGEAISGDSREAVLNLVLGEIHAYISQHLAAAEQGEERRNERPVVIHCFSSLSWKYALVAYDAVRQYEREQAGVRISSSQDLRHMREASFAPPRIRNYHPWERGNELHEILHAR